MENPSPPDLEEADTLTEAAPAAPAARQRPASRWPGRLKRLVLWSLALLLCLGLIGTLAVNWLDTVSGRQWAARQLASLETEAGFALRVGGFRGSLFGEMTAVDVSLHDTRGQFAHAPAVALVWWPWDLLRQRVNIGSLRAETLVIERRPEFRPIDRDRPLLPEFEINIRRLRIDQLVLEEAAAGERFVLEARGRLHLTQRTATLSLDVGGTNSEDKLALAATIAPDRNDLDLNLHVNAPSGGALGGYLGTDHGFTLATKGDGTWTRWRGALEATYDNAPLLDLQLAADDGRFRLNGPVHDAPGLPPVLQRLLAGTSADSPATFSLEATVRDGALDNRLELKSRPLVLTAQGLVDIRSGALSNAGASLRLTDPSALVPNLRATPFVFTLTAEGRIRNPRLVLDGKAEALHFGRVTLGNITARAVSETGSMENMALEARLGRADGLGPILEPRLSGATVNGRFTFRPRQLLLALEDGQLRGSNIGGKVNGHVNFRSQDYRLGMDGALERIEFPKIVRGTLDAKLVFAGRTFASRTTISGTAQSRPLQPLSPLVSGLIGSEGRLASTVTRGEDGVFRLPDLRLTASALNLSGTFAIAPGGIVSGRVTGPLTAPAGSLVTTPQGPAQVVLTASGTLPDYRLELDTRLAEAVIGPERLTELRLTGQSDRLEQFRLGLTGGSILGSIEGSTLLTVRGGPAFRNLSLRAGNVLLDGALHLAEGRSWQGDLAVSGGGLTGRIVLPGTPGPSLANIDLAGQTVRLGVPGSRLSIDRLSAKGRLRLSYSDPGFTGIFRIEQAATTTLRLEHFTLSSLQQGDGSRLRLSMKGRRGAPFDFDGTADLSPAMVRITGSGHMAGEAVRLTRTAEFAVAPGGGWILRPTELALGNGTLQLDGRWSPRERSVNATAKQISATALELVRPGTGIDGRLSGTAAYAWAAGQRPTATADLTVQDLHRAGLIGRSTPVTLRVKAAVRDNTAEATLTASESGRPSGTVALSLSPLQYGNGAMLPSNWRSVPLTGTVSWNGRADALWALTGIEAHEVTGPATIQARLGGTVGNPDIAGNIRSSGASYENLGTGLRVTNIEMEAAFRGARLDIQRLGGQAGKTGRVTATGWLELSAERGFPADVQVALDRASIMRRDDIQAWATGNARLTHGPEGGLIAGKLRITQARLKMGGTTAANPVPRIAYEEVGVRAVHQPVATRPPVIKPFRLDLELTAPDEVMLEGIGLHSEWSGQLAVRGTSLAPSLTGRLDLVRGTYEFSGRDFDLDRGQIILRGETPPDPILDIVASHTLDGITVNIEIKGTARRPEVVFTSTPRLPQEEVLSRLLFGASVPNLSATEAVQLGTALAALQGGNPDLNIIGRVGKAVGIDRLRVMPGDRRKGIGTTFSGGKYITDKVYLEVATDGRGYTATLVEIDLTRTLSLLSQVATLGSTDVSLKWSRDY
ncbi:MAG TPA: translocation/assembly module TamB domain-containing protein [Pedomonas sp.]|uniref:translocation/assembly module TamB domain-containing protein n=1 Tax=Pedomonas sp. TaxID=2976421 RepID=UPI002F419D31